MKHYAARMLGIPIAFEFKAEIRPTLAMKRMEIYATQGEDVLQLVRGGQRVEPFDLVPGRPSVFSAVAFSER